MTSEGESQIEGGLRKLHEMTGSPFRLLDFGNDKYGVITRLPVEENMGG